MDPADLFPSPEVTPPSITASELKAKIDRGETVTLLDTRGEGQFDAWHLTGENVENHNVPYFDFFEGVDDDLLARLPEEPFYVICAKGGASEYIAGILVEEGVDATDVDDGMHGWARIYEAAELTGHDGPGTVVQYQRPSNGCLAYLVHDGDEAAVVDPLRMFTERYVEDAAALGVEIRYVFDTHMHADHVSGVRELARETGANVLVPAAAVARGLDYDLEYVPVEHGDAVEVGEVTIEVVHTPGHSTDLTAYRVGDTLFSGDGLFVDSVGRPDLEAGDDGARDAASTLYETLQGRVLSLPDETLVAPAHYNESTEPAEDGTYTVRLGELKASVPAFSMSEDEFVEFVLSDMPPRPANFEDIYDANLGKRSLDEDDAFEVELGPNNCAATRESIADD